MKWAIIFYAFITAPGGEKIEHVSWGLTFPHHEKCIEFFEENEYKLIKGLTEFLEKQYGTIVLEEVGCAHATADFDKQDSVPFTSLHMPLWKGTST